MRTNLGQWSLVTLVALLVGTMAHAGPRLGSSVTLRVNGEAEYKSPDGRADLDEGLALSQGHTILPGGEAYVDAAITMGGIIRVKDGNDLYLKQLEQTSDGLPDSEKDYSRYIVLSMSRGTLYVNAGDECDCLALRIETPAGNIESHGSRFVVTREGAEWKVKGVTGRTEIIPKDSEERTEIKEGETGDFTQKDVQTTSTPDGDAQVSEYNVFWMSTEPLEQYLMCLGEEGCVCFDCFTDWMGKNLPQSGDTRSSPPLKFVGEPLRWLDVSPATRR